MLQKRYRSFVGAVIGLRRGQYVSGTVGGTRCAWQTGPPGARFRRGRSPARNLLHLRTSGRLNRWPFFVPGGLDLGGPQLGCPVLLGLCFLIFGVIVGVGVVVFVIGRVVCLFSFPQ